MNIKLKEKLQAHCFRTTYCPCLHYTDCKNVNNPSIAYQPPAIVIKHDDEKHQKEMKRKFNDYHDNALDEMMSFDRDTPDVDKDREYSIDHSPQSDIVKEAKEAEEVQRRALKAAIHTGETRWHTQG